MERIINRIKKIYISHFVGDYPKYWNIVVNKINSFTFHGLEEIKVGDALYFNISNTTEWNKSLIDSFLETQLDENKNLDITCEKIGIGGSSTLLFTEYNIVRADHMVWMNNIAKSIGNCMMIQGCLNEERKYGVPDDFCEQLEAYSKNWKANFNKIHILTTHQREYLLQSLIRHYIEYSLVWKFIKDNEIRTLACFSDAHQTSSLLVQKSNLHGIKTVTFVHAFYTENWYYNCHAKHMILYGEKMYKMALNGTNIESEKDILDKYRVLGDPRLISKELPEEVAWTNHKIWGIIFDLGFLNNRYNKKLLDIVIEEARNKGVEIICKIHPSNYGEELPDEYKNSISGVYCKETSVEKFMQMVDVGFFITSTVFAEFIMQMKPAFRLKSNSYSDITWCAFDSAEELAAMYDKYDKDDALLELRIKETREYLSITDSIAENYRRFFGEIND